MARPDPARPSDAFLQRVASLLEGRQPFSTGDVQAAAGRAQRETMGVRCPSLPISGNDVAMARD
jgi:hypothetical protein